jgi:PPOX class probable F420-dependent enzyme
LRSKPGLLAALLLCAAGTVTSLAQAIPADAASEGTRLLDVARQVMAAARYCTLVTLGADSQPQARIMDPLEPEADMTVWFATNPATRKVDEVRRDPRVTLLYFDPKGPSFVTLLGRASVVDDPAEKARRFKEEWAPFYRDRNRGPDYVLIRVRVHRLEVVSQPHGIVNDPENWRPRSIDLARDTP